MLLTFFKCFKFYAFTNSIIHVKIESSLIIPTLHEQGNGPGQGQDGVLVFPDEITPFGVDRLIVEVLDVDM